MFCCPSFICSGITAKPSILKGIWVEGWEMEKLWMLTEVNAWRFVKGLGDGEQLRNRDMRIYGFEGLVKGKRVDLYWWRVNKSGKSDGS